MTNAIMQPPRISSVLTELLNSAQITESDLSRAVNLPRATINRIRAGKITDPRSSTITAIASYFAITVDQLLGYSPLIINESHQKIINATAPEINLDSLKKYISQTTNFNLSKESINQIAIEIDKEQYRTANIFAMKVSGDAMWPYFDDKSIVIIDTNLSPENRNFIIAYIKRSEEFIIRQLFIEGNNTKILKAINPIFESIRLTNEDIIVGVIFYVKKHLLQ